MSTLKGLATLGLQVSFLADRRALERNVVGELRVSCFVCVRIMLLLRESAPADKRNARWAIIVDRS